METLPQLRLSALRIIGEVWRQAGAAKKNPAARRPVKTGKTVAKVVGRLQPEDRAKRKSWRNGKGCRQRRAKARRPQPQTPSPAPTTPRPTKILEKKPSVNKPRQQVALHLVGVSLPGRENAERLKSWQKTVDGCECQTKSPSRLPKILRWRLMTCREKHSWDYPGDIKEYLRYVR